jgi:TPR repeat protein
LLGACGSKSNGDARVVDDAANNDGAVDPSELAARFDRKCVQGDLEACRNLGILYSEGQGVSQDQRRATALFGQACNGGNLSSCNHLGLALTAGMGVDKQPDKAAAAYQKACDGGYKLACRNLGMLLRDEHSGIPQDLPKAEQLFDKACKGNVPFACTNAGDLDAYLAAKGPGATARYKSAIAHYKQGCDGGDPTACRQIGIAYLEGRGLPKSPPAAAVWLERGCIPEEPIACRLLGLMKVQGIGVARDLERGKQMLSRACEKKDDEACRLLGSINDTVTNDAGVGDGGEAMTIDAAVDAMKPVDAAKGGGGSDAK